MKICFIEQPSGLGDILLGSKIGTHFAKMGHRVIWPISPTYSTLREHISTEGIEYFDMSTDYDYKREYEAFVNKELCEVYEDNNFIHVPTRRSFFSKAGKEIHVHDSHDAANMHGKFAMCSLGYKDWQDYFEIIRNPEREETLFENLRIERPYHLINKNFGTPPLWREVLNKNIAGSPLHQRLDMFMDPRFSVFDWLKVFEKAVKIDTVSTSTFYLFEKIDLECIPTIYSRNTNERNYNENFGWLQALSRKNYLFIN
jgi:hypothetical protein